MKNMWIWIIVIVIILAGLAYLGRHKIKSMLGMSTPTVTVTQTKTKSPPVSQSAAAPTNNIYLVKTDSTKGKYMTDFQGMTLYTYDHDTSGVSNCTGGCLATWPVYTSGATAQGTFPTNISVITRADGTKQFAWKGMPLYYYKSDTKAGDINGDGVGGVWHIVKM